MGNIVRKRSKAEMARTFILSLDRPEWLWWSLHRERLASEDAGEADSLWHDVLCRAIDALNIHDWGEVTRAVSDLADIAGIKLTDI